MNDNTNTLYQSLNITRNRNGEPTTTFTHRHTKYLKLLGALRDQSFETLWYDKETTAFNQTSESVHIKGSKGEFIVIEYTNGTIDIMPKEDGDDGYDLQAIILAANYPSEPVTIDVKSASWGNATKWQPELLVRVDTEPETDYYINVSLDDNGSRATIQGIAPKERLYGNEISETQAVENLLTQYHEMSSKPKDALNDEWGADADPEEEIRRLVTRNKNKNRPITDTLHLSHFDILNYCVEYKDLDPIPDADDIHPVEEPEPDHRTTDLHDELDELQTNNQEHSTTPDDTNSSLPERTVSADQEPDHYVNGNPIYSLN